MTTSLDERSRVTLSPNVYARTFGEEIVLLEFGKGEYFGLDAVAAEVWRRLEAGDDLGTTADHIVAHYDVERAQALDDILALVAELQKNELVAGAPSTEMG
jgi:hypothetical protein